MHFFTTILTRRCARSNLHVCCSGGERSALYGRMHSLRAWCGKFSDVVQWFGMHRCQCDYYVFSSMTQRGRTQLIASFDDLIITGDDTKGVEELKTYLQGQFHTKNFGQLRYFLGIEVTRSKEGSACPNGSMC